jgi:hypothetical protein
MYSTRRTFIRIAIVCLLLAVVLAWAARPGPAADTIAGHPVKLDGQGKLIPWYLPAANAYGEFLDRRWKFIKMKVPLSPGPPPRSDYPQYFFYDGYVTKEKEIKPDNWMNDVGEKVPNWFESARLYYAYSGDAEPMAIVRRLIDYSLEHGTSPTDFTWPRFPYTTTNPGDTKFKGFTGKFALHETHVDHAGDMGLSYFRLYQYTRDEKYLKAAITVADALVAHVRTGTATKSIWPYRVRMDNGQITAEYGANWIGCYALLDELARAGRGNPTAYAAAAAKARDFVLQFPMKTGFWTDGHSDNPVNSHTYKSNLSKSNAVLYILDHPQFDPEWKSNVPKYIKWTEEHFVFRTDGKEPATAFGANVVGEQDGFNFKMDYQTARYAAECARWYRICGDDSYRENAYRSLNWVTYCSDGEGRATESPYSPHIASWWSDCYGECPRMFYHVFAAMPEWAPPRQDHILYSYGVLADVSYRRGIVEYAPCDPKGIEYLRLSYRPAKVALDGRSLPETTDLATEGWSARSLGGGDYAVIVRRVRAGVVRLTAHIEHNGTPAEKD